MLLQQPSQISPQQQNLTTQQRQQQQQQGGVSDSPPASNASGGAEDVQRTGPWQSLLLLSYVDLSRNELTGEKGWAFSSAIGPGARKAGRNDCYLLGLRSCRGLPGWHFKNSYTCDVPGYFDQQRNRCFPASHHAKGLHPSQTDKPNAFSCTAWYMKTHVTGPVPPSLARAPSLMYLSLAFNALSGSLKPFADALAANAAASSLLVLDVSNNKLTGAVPAGLAAAPMLDPNTRAVGRQG